MAGEKTLAPVNPTRWSVHDSRNSEDPRSILMKASSHSSFQGLERARAHPLAIDIGDGQVPVMRNCVATYGRVRIWMS